VTTGTMPKTPEQAKATTTCASDELLVVDRIYQHQPNSLMDAGNIGSDGTAKGTSVDDPYDSEDESELPPYERPRIINVKSSGYGQKSLNDSANNSPNGKKSPWRGTQKSVSKQAGGKNMAARAPKREKYVTSASVPTPKKVPKKAVQKPAKKASQKSQQIGSTQKVGKKTGSKKVKKAKPAPKSILKMSSASVPYDEAKLSRHRDYINDEHPPSLTFTHKVEGLSKKSSKSKKSPRSPRSPRSRTAATKSKPSVTASKRSQMTTLNMPKNMPVYHSKSYHGSYRKSSFSVISRADPRLDNVKPMVDTRRKTLAAPPSSRPLVNPSTGRIIIRQTKSSQARISKAKTDRNKPVHQPPDKKSVHNKPFK